MEFAGVFDNRRPAGDNDPVEFSQGGRHVGHMVHHPDHRQGIEQVITKRQSVDVGHYEDESLILAQVGPSLLQLGAGIIGLVSAVCVLQGLLTGGFFRTVPEEADETSYDSSG